MPQIRFKNGTQKGKIVQIEGSEPVIIGREPEAGLQIVDKGVSRQHAEIFRVGEMVFIRDLGSRNGTYVNSEKLDEELLREGDLVRVGTTQLVFESTKAVHDAVNILKYEEDGEFRSSLELKIDDLFVGEGASTGREREHFRAVCLATKIVHSESTEQKRFDLLLDLIQDYIPADHIYLFIKDRKTGAIAPCASRRKGSEHIPISRTILRRVVTEARAILTADAMQDARFNTGESIVLNQIRSVLCVPVQAGADNVGAIYAVNARVAETFDESDLQLLTAIGAQLAFSMEQANTIQTRSETINGVLERVMMLIESHSTEESSHAERVSRFSVEIARELGLPQAEIHNIRLAGLLHNMGKIKDLSTFKTPADTTKDVEHIYQVKEMFKGVQGIDPIIECILAYKERYDGTGIPSGVQGEAIPLGARILSVANRFDHLLQKSGTKLANQTDGSFVKNLFTEMTEEGGKAFDMAVIQALIVAFRHGAILPEKPKPPIEEVEILANNAAGTSKVSPIIVGQDENSERDTTRESTQRRSNPDDSADESES